MLTTTFLALALLAPADGAGAPPEPAAQRDFQQPPAGSAADRRLWQALYDVNGLAAFHMARIGQSAYRIRFGGYYQGLDARLAEGAAAAGLRERLERAALEADRALPADGGRVRACRYVLLDLEQRMDLLDDPTSAAELPRHRAAATDCVTRLTGLVAALRPSADALEAVLLEIDAFLGRAVVVPAAPPDDPGPAGEAVAEEYR